MAGNMFQKAAATLAIGAIVGVPAVTTADKVFEFGGQVMHGLQNLAGQVSPSDTPADNPTQPTIPK